jgi:hypothetical protein
MQHAAILESGSAQLFKQQIYSSNSQAPDKCPQNEPPDKQLAAAFAQSVPRQQSGSTQVAAVMQVAVHRHHEGLGTER